MHISTGNKTVTDEENVAIVIEYKVAYGLSIEIFVI